MPSIFSADWRNEINREIGAKADQTAVDAALAKRVRVDAAQSFTPAEQERARANISAPLKGHIFGLTLSNNASDATNDIDIATGEAASTETNPVLMVLALGLTKRLDALWAPGTNQGGRDTGSIANTTYHVWLIQRSDTGVVDVLFSASATSPTMPANYDRKRRIGSIKRESAAIVAFWQNGDVFRRAAAIDRNSTAATASILLTLSVPTGIVVAPIVHMSASVGASGALAILLGSAASGSASIQVAGSAGNGWVLSVIPTVFYSNTSAQIYYAQSNSGVGPDSNTLTTLGWIDTRGRDA